MAYESDTKEYIKEYKVVLNKIVDGVFVPVTDSKYEKERDQYKLDDLHKSVQLQEEKYAQYPLIIDLNNKLLNAFENTKSCLNEHHAIMACRDTNFKSFQDLLTELKQSIR